MMKELIALKDGESTEGYSSLLIMVPFGENKHLMGDKMLQLAAVYEISQFNFGEGSGETSRKEAECQQEFRDLVKIDERTQDNYRRKLIGLATVSKTYGCSLIEEYYQIVSKYRLIYNTLNLFSETESLYIGSFWAPASQRDNLLLEMVKLKVEDPNFVTADIFPISQDKVPPTFFKLNSFTTPFQTLVNTFSIPKYKEINPALVTSVTFPFLFGVMFGDIGHGLVMFLFGLYLNLKKKDINLADNSPLAGVLSYRYLIMMMGFFSVYCGLIYNDFLGIKLILGPSCYTEQSAKGPKGEELSFVRKPGCVYWVGFDWVWGMAKNEIEYFNSYKMKQSIIFGFIHMMVGLLFKGRHRYDQV